MFQIDLSERLRAHLLSVAGGKGNQPVVHDVPLMRQVPGYAQESFADETVYFHGREVRQVPDAAGGMGFKLHLSLANDDPEGG